MHLDVGIDPGSGFCGGVIRAIRKAEEYLSHNDTLVSLGAIVHNEKELDRLGAEGLVSVNSLSEVENGGTVLIRAHGEPPGTYDEAARKGLTIIDCTCPVVLKLQESIRRSYQKLHEGGSRGQIIIFGKIGHAEVLGLVGQVAGDAVVVENLSMLETLVAEGIIDLGVRTEVFSQTTKSPSEYAALCARLGELMPGRLTVHGTICAQVASRHSALVSFASEHDVVVFVSGASSSNGRVLCDLCRRVNPRTYHISSSAELSREWFRDGDRVGVCGATSTPKWLLDEVAEAIRIEKFAGIGTNV